LPCPVAALHVGGDAIVEEQLRVKDYVSSAGLRVSRYATGPFTTFANIDETHSSFQYCSNAGAVPPLNTLLSYSNENVKAKAAEVLTVHETLLNSPYGIGSGVCLGKFKVSSVLLPPINADGVNYDHQKHSSPRTRDHLNDLNIDCVEALYS
jgi:hypothetical protein